MGGPRQPRQRIDITQFLSEQARELVNAAARRAAEVGSPDLDTDHLLWPMTEEDPTRQLISRAGTDPAQLRAELDDLPRRGEPRAETPALTPAAKRALLDAHQISRACSLRNWVMSMRWRGWRAPPMYRAKKSSKGLP